MSKTQIFVEGKGDVKFLKDYLAFIKVNSENIIITSLDGWTNIRKANLKFLENTNKNGKNLVIFDADQNYDERKSEILAIKSDLKIEFELFLCPNDRDSGCIESILFSILDMSYSDILDCFDSYSSCLGSRYKPPSQKDKLFALLDALRKETRIEKRDYLNDSLWDLNHPKLSNIKDFLLKNLTLD